jgi:tRNA U34 5-carboxymethylaminomethyl modifying enzyme MnmG/GidA
MYAASLQNLIQRLEFQVKDLQKEGLDDEAALNLQRDLISDLNEDVRRESIRLMALDVDVQRLLALQHAQQMEIQHHIEQRIQDQIRRAQYMADVKEKISAMLDMAHL